MGEAALPAAAQHVLAAIRTRRSTPHVLPEAPPRHLIDLLLEAANHAPNHYLTQPWRFTVLTGDARRRLGLAALEGIRERWPLEDPEKAATRDRTVPEGFLRAPVVIAVAAAPPGHPHTEPWEELVATAAASAPRASSLPTPSRSQVDHTGQGRCGGRTLLPLTAL